MIICSMLFIFTYSCTADIVAGPNEINHTVSTWSPDAG